MRAPGLTATFAAIAACAGLPELLVFDSWPPCFANDATSADRLPAAPHESEASRQLIGDKVSQRKR